MKHFYKTANFRSEKISTQFPLYKTTPCLEQQVTTYFGLKNEEKPV